MWYQKASPEEKSQMKKMKTVEKLAPSWNICLRLEVEGVPRVDTAKTIVNLFQGRGSRQELIKKARGKEIKEFAWEIQKISPRNQKRITEKLKKKKQLSTSFKSEKADKSWLKSARKRNKGWGGQQWRYIEVFTIFSFLVEVLTQNCKKQTK